MWCIIETIFLIFLFVVTNSYMPSSLQENNVLVKDINFVSLRVCLNSVGVDIKNLHHRDSGNKYTELNWQWSKLNGYIKPMAYLVANKVSDVQNAVICCQLSKIRKVARSGGHSYVKNSFGDSSSLVVDLSRLNHISLDPIRMTSEIGPGARNGQIYYTLWNEGNFTISAGICPTVGIAGLALGGGYGFNTRLFGLTTDSLIELEMVDAKGKLLVINSNKNSDLFWALRGGGGGSYGIVTKLKFKIHPQPKSIVFGIYEYDFSEFSLFYNAWQSFIASGLPNNIGTIIEMTKNKIQLKVYAFNLRDVKNTISVRNIESLLKSFSFPRAINSSIEIQSYSEFILSRAQYYSPTLLTHPSQLANITKHRYVGWKKIKSIYVEKILNKSDISNLEVLVSSLLEWSALNIELNGGAINNFSRSETAFFHRGNNLYHMHLIAFSPESEQPNFEAEMAIKTFYDESRAILNHRESYQNYLDQDIPDYLRRYYGMNLKRLIKVKRRIDPENVFYHPQSIPVNYY